MYFSWWCACCVCCRGREMRNFCQRKSISKLMFFLFASHSHSLTHTLSAAFCFIKMICTVNCTHRSMIDANIIFHLMSSMSLPSFLFIRSCFLDTRMLFFDSRWFALRWNLSLYYYFGLLLSIFIRVMCRVCAVSLFVSFDFTQQIVLGAVVWPSLFVHWQWRWCCYCCFLLLLFPYHILVYLYIFYEIEDYAHTLTNYTRIRDTNRGRENHPLLAKSTTLKKKKYFIVIGGLRDSSNDDDSRNDNDNKCDQCPPSPNTKKRFIFFAIKNRKFDDFDVNTSKRPHNSENHWMDWWTQIATGMKKKHQPLTFNGIDILGIECLECTLRWMYEMYISTSLVGEPILSPTHQPFSVTGTWHQLTLHEISIFVIASENRIRHNE